MKRRDFVKSATLGSLLPILLKSGGLVFANVDNRPQRPDTLLHILLFGGADGLSILAPYSDPLYQQARPDIGLDTSNLISMNSGFGYHSALSGLNGIYGDGDLAFIHGVGIPDYDAIPNAAGAYPGKTRSHFTAKDLAHAGVADSNRWNDDLGWVGRASQINGIDRWSCNRGESPFNAVSVSSNIPVELIGAGGVSAPSPCGFGLNMRCLEDYKSAFINTLSALHMNGSVQDEAVQNLILALDEIEAALPGQGCGSGASGGGPLENQLVELAGLLNAGIDIVFAYLEFSNWDFHQNQNDYFPGKLEELADGIVAFKSTLNSDLWDYTTGICTTEFGRRIQQNGDKGTEHGSGGVAMMFGGSVAGGYYTWSGSLDDMKVNTVTGDPMNADVGIITDVRTLFGEALVNLFSFEASELDQIFPGYPPGGHLTFPGVITAQRGEGCEDQRQPDDPFNPGGEG